MARPTAASLPDADFQRRGYGALGLVFRQTSDAETEHRNRVLVIESYGRYGARIASQRHSPACETESSRIRTKPSSIVERADRRHLIGAEFEIEQVKITRNPCGVH